MVILATFWFLMCKLSLCLSHFASFLVNWNFIVRASRHAMCFAISNVSTLYVRRWMNLWLFLLYGYLNWYPAMDEFESLSSLESLSTYLVVYSNTIYWGITCTVLCNLQGRYYYTNILGIFCFIPCPILSLTIPIWWVPTRNVLLLYLAILFNCIVAYTRKLCYFWGLRLSRAMISSLVLYAISRSMISLLVLYTVHAFIWFDTAICNRVLYSNTCLMGNQLYEEDLLVAITSFMCYQLNIYGFILYYRCLFFTSNQSVHMIMKSLVPSAEFTMQILIGCYGLSDPLLLSPRS